MVTCVVEGGFGGYYAIWVEARRQSLKMDECADEQAGPGEEHDSERDFAGDEGLAEANGVTGGGRASWQGKSASRRGEQREQGAFRRARW